MSYIKGINRNQSILFPEIVDDYIQDDNPIRFIDAFVDNLNLVEMGFKNAIENVGNNGVILTIDNLIL